MKFDRSFLFVLLSFLTVSFLLHRQKFTLRSEVDCSERDTSPCFDCSNVSLLSVDRERFASGFYKQANHAHFNGQAFVVKTPSSESFEYLKSRWLQKYGETLSIQEVRRKIAEKFNRERWSLREYQAMGPFVPLVFGGCYDHSSSSFNVITVMERLRTFADVIVDSGVTLRQRLRIAASSIDLVQSWDHWPSFYFSRAETDAISSIKNYTVPDATAFIYADFDAKQFGVDSGYHVKLLDLDARESVPYARHKGNFGAELNCETDEDCTSYFFQFGIARRIEKRQYLSVPDDFQCNTTRQRCNGLNERSNLYNMCSILLVPLLVDFVPEPEKYDSEHEFLLGKVKGLLNRCLSHAREQRISAETLRRQFSILSGPPGDSEPAKLLDTSAKLSAAELSIANARINKLIKKQRLFGPP